MKDNSDSTQTGLVKSKLWWRRRSKLERKLIIALVATVIFLTGTLLYATYQTAERTSKSCTTPGCLVAASEIIRHIDPSIDPCDDFFKFACGKFIEHSHGDIRAASIKELEGQIERQVSEIIQEPVGKDDHRMVKAQKKLFQACLNETAVGEEALDVFNEVLEDINGWPVVVGYNWKHRRFNWTTFVYKLRRRGYLSSMMLDVDVIPDPENSKKNILYISEPFLSTIKDEHKELYKQYMTDLAVKFGADEEYAELEMENVLDFMEKLKKVADKNIWGKENSTISDERNRTAELMSTKHTIEEFQKMHAEIHWLGFINNVLYPVTALSNTDSVIFPKSEFVEEFFALIEDTPKRVQANYMVWKIADLIMTFFPKEYKKLEENYDCLTDSHLSNTKDRLDFCKSMVSRSFYPVPTNILYARSYLPAERRAKIQEMVTNVKSAFISVLEETSWLDQESKEKVLVKAQALSEIIGGPGDYFDDKVFEMYSSEEEVINDDDSFFTVFLARMKQRADNNFAEIKKPINDSSLEIFFNFVSKVNAMYSPGDNAIVLPVGILQGIFYNPNRPAYLNYGALGSIVGHEFTHGFLKDTNKYEKDGKEVNMWTSATEKAYEEKTKCVVQVAENFDVEDTENTINGTLTLEENIADFTGIKVSYGAYKKWVKENGEEPQLTGIDYTPYQVFWISAILHECYKLSGEKLERSLENDMHALNAFRATAPMRNNPDFAEDFGCPADSLMNPSEKCQVF